MFYQLTILLHQCLSNFLTAQRAYHNYISFVFTRIYQDLKYEYLYLVVMIYPLRLFFALPL